MHAALTIDPTKGRALRKGVQRALPLLVFVAVMLCGAVLTAKALYIPIKAQVAQVMLTRAFDASVQSGAPVKPWSWADTAPMAKVSAPRLGVSEIVLSGGSGEAMAFGPTAILDSAGSDVTVLAAHRDTHFEFVQDLVVGDEVVFERIDGGVAHYRVTQLETVRWDEFGVPSDGGAGVLALTTCYPFDTDKPGPLRRVAWATRIEA